MLADLVNTNRLEDYMDELRKEVKRDETTKRVIFLTLLSAYTASPINLFLRGPSSIGKTYVTVMTAKIFPQENIIYIGKLSPTALAHDHGKLIDERDGKEFTLFDAPSKHDFKNEKGKIDHPELKKAKRAWAEKLKNSFYAVDLNNKVLLFLEAPDVDTFLMLRPILSHDVKELSHKVTQQTGSGGHGTKHIKLRGFPATIFCTTSLDYLEELATRSLTHTPDMNLDKYAEAVQLLGEKASFPWFFEFEDPNRAYLRDKLTEITDRCKENNRVVIPYAQYLSTLYKVVMPRDMRDYNKLQNLIDSSTMLHYDTRPVITIDFEGTPLVAAVANFVDLYNSISIFSSIEEATRAGISAHVVRIFYDIIVKHWNRSTTARSIKETRQAYREAIGTSIGRTQFYEYMKALEEVGWIEMEQNLDDRRQKLITVTKGNLGNSLLSSIDEFKTRCTPDFMKGYIETLCKKVVQGKVYMGTCYDNPQEFLIYDSTDGVVDFAHFDDIFGEEYFSGLLMDEIKSEISITQAPATPIAKRKESPDTPDSSDVNPLMRDMAIVVDMVYELTSEEDKQMIAKTLIINRLFNEKKWTKRKSLETMANCVKNRDLQELGELVGLVA